MQQIEQWSTYNACFLSSAEKVRYSSKYSSSCVLFFSNTANASAPRQCSLLTTLVQRPDGPYFRFPGKGVYSFASDCEDDPLFEVNVQTDITCAGGSKSDCYAIFIRFVLSHP